MSRFWDTSVVIPLLVNEPATGPLLALLRDEEHMIVWGGMQVECVSALARRVHEGELDTREETQARAALARFVTA